MAVRLTVAGDMLRASKAVVYVAPPALIDALGIRNSTVHVYFTLSTDAGVAYTTG